MTVRRVYRKIERTPEEQSRIQAIRDYYQKQRPTPDELLASEESRESMPLGENEKDGGPHAKARRRKG
jgi:hypothetical protein